MLLLLVRQGDTTLQVTIITTVGLIVVAAIGVVTAKITSGARQESQANAQNASVSAFAAKSYADALEERKAANELLEARLVRVEQHHLDCVDRLAELERKTEEHDESRRASALIEREQHEEIVRLRSELEGLKKKR